MATISNPFVMEVPRKLTDEELVNAIRQDIIGELEAIHEYDAHVQATDNEDAKKVLSDIRDEEREHMGELLELLERLAPDEKALHDEGRGEVREMLDKSRAWSREPPVAIGLGVSRSVYESAAGRIGSAALLSLDGADVAAGAPAPSGSPSASSLRSTATRVWATTALTRERLPLSTSPEEQSMATTPYRRPFMPSGRYFSVASRQPGSP